MIVAGQIIEDGGQRYECVRVDPYVRRDGSKAGLAVLASHCAQCGSLFHTNTPILASRLQLSRRCPAHKRPGSKVRRKIHAQRH